MSLEHENDKKFGGEDDGFTAAVEPGHQVHYDEQPEVHSGLKRQLKSRHVSPSISSPGLPLINYRWP